MCREITFVHPLLRLTQFNDISKPAIEIWGEKMDINISKDKILQCMVVYSTHNFFIKFIPESLSFSFTENSAGTCESSGHLKDKELNRCEPHTEFFVIKSWSV